MTQARLSITLTEDVWIADVSRAHPEATFRVLAAMPGEDAGFGLVRLTAPDVESILEEMRAAADVTSLSSLHRDGERAVVQFETTQPLILLSARESRTSIELPVDVRDGIATAR